MISFVCWLWNVKGYRTQFTPSHVNTLARMIARNYDAPHRTICVTSDPAGIDPSVEIVPDHADFADVPSPHGDANPSCYRRLRMFAHDAEATFGERIVSLDLDCVITGDILPLFDRNEDFVGWSDPWRPAQYNGSMTMIRAGSRAKVWELFDLQTSRWNAMAAGCLGSDQGWVSYCLGPGEAQWTRADGVYSYRWDKLVIKPLPSDARIVFFHGETKPWDYEPQRYLEWVRRHYQ